MFQTLFQSATLHRLTRLCLIVSFFFPTIVYSYNCVQQVNPTTPNERFLVNGDSTISDLSTGLMWQRCNVGLSGMACDIGTIRVLNWQQTLLEISLINEINQPEINMGYNDWRVPNLNELASIVEEACYEPAINLGIFLNTIADEYWSSSSSLTDESQAWAVNFNVGSVSEIIRTRNNSVRLVRNTD